MKQFRNNDRPSAGARLGWILFLTCATACSSSARTDGGPPDEQAPTLVFPKTFREAGFREVRRCRAPGEHSGLGGFTVWVNELGADAYGRILAASDVDGGAARMPTGSIVVKELYADEACRTIDHWVAMAKIDGYDTAHGDWFWQDVSARKTITAEGRVPSCFGCHEGRDDGTCVGFGAVNGRDYLCTAP